MPLHEFLAEEAPKNENFLLKPLDKSEHIMLTHSHETENLCLLGVVFLGYCSTTNANITGTSWCNDGDGAINCTQQGGGAFDGSSLYMAGETVFRPGPHDRDDYRRTPRVTRRLGLYSSVNNDTSFAWTSYVVNVYMAVPFSIVGLGC